MYCDISVTCPAQEIAPDLTDAGITGAGYVFNSPEDQRDIKTQRQAIWDLVKNLGSHLLREGVNLTKISLPVRVFEPRSFLQRLTDNWAYIPLLEQAAAAADPADRMRLVVSTIVTIKFNALHSALLAYDTAACVLALGRSSHIIDLCMQGCLCHWRTQKADIHTEALQSHPWGDL